ncbi:MAG: hypothetical protein D6731_10710 [Planctomycetota bacterium]|nr:MAG: hypothetical protein D6731_10710 [Planctomycetota bacterium]
MLIPNRPWYPSGTSLGRISLRFCSTFTGSMKNMLRNRATPATAAPTPSSATRQPHTRQNLRKPLPPAFASSGCSAWNSSKSLTLPPSPGGPKLSTERKADRGRRGRTVPKARSPSAALERPAPPRSPRGGRDPSRPTRTEPAHRIDATHDPVTTMPSACSRPRRGSVLLLVFALLSALAGVGWLLLSDGVPPPAGAAPPPQKTPRTPPAPRVTLGPLPPEAGRSRGPAASAGPRPPLSSATAHAGIRRSEAEDPPPGRARLIGHVVDPSGRPVGGAVVQLLYESGSGSLRGSPTPNLRQETDDRGDFALVVEPGSYRLSAKMSGFAPACARSLRLSPDEVRDSGDLVLRRSCSLRGRVLSSDGRPLPGARVVASGPTMRQSTTTDREGCFRLDGLAEDVYTVSALLSGWVDALVREVPVTVEEGGEVEFRLERAGTLGGTLLGSDGFPLEGGLVFAFAGERGLGKARSDAQGNYSIEDLPAGDVVLLARSEDHAVSARGKATVVAGSLTPLDLVLKESPRIEGVLRNRRGEPLAGLRVVAHSRIGYAVRRSEPTGSDGRYRIELLYPGRYSLEVLRDAGRHALSPCLASAEVEAPGGVVARDLVVPSPALLAGCLRDERDRPVADAQVDASVGREVRGTTRSDDAGRFRFPELPAGRYTVFAYRGNDQRTGQGVVELHEGERREDFELVLRPPAFLRGRILLPDGRPAARLELRLRGVDASVCRGSPSDAEGCFELGPLSDGDYVLEADSESLRLLERRAGRPGLTLPAATVRVRAGRTPDLELSLRASP